MRREFIKNEKEKAKLFSDEVECLIVFEGKDETKKKLCFELYHNISVEGDGLHKFNGVMFSFGYPWEYIFDDDFIRWCQGFISLYEQGSKNSKGLCLDAGSSSGKEVYIPWETVKGLILKAKNAVNNPSLK